MRKTLLYFFSVVVAFLFGVAVVYLCIELLGSLVLEYSDWLFLSSPWFSVAAMGVSLGAGLAVARRLSPAVRRVLSLGTDRPRAPLWARASLLVAYLVTWIVAVPAVQSTNDRWAVGEYKRLRDEERNVWSAHPSFRTYVAVPVLPCTVLSYHEYQLGGLYGWGGWELQLWYGFGVVPLFSVTKWIS